MFVGIVWIIGWGNKAALHVIFDVGLDVGVIVKRKSTPMLGFGVFCPNGLVFCA